LTAITRSHSSESISANGFRAILPKRAALLTSTWTPPNACSVARTSAETASGLLTSQIRPIASPPAAWIACTTVSGGSRSHTLTRAPSAAKARA